MSKLSLSGSRFRPSLSLVLLVTLLLILWLAGGSVRADAMGQAVVRGAAALLLIAAILFGKRPALARAWPIWLLLTAAIALTLIQLIPLPPGVWQSLPGRAMFIEAAAASGQAQPWRPLSLVPDATVNAAASLLVPLATLVLVTGLPEEEERWLPGIMLGLVVASMLLGLLQFSGAGFSNPFINETPGMMGGSFANRNHFALFLGIGCLLVPVWTFLGGRRPHWRVSVGVGLALLFALAILATGSRAGMALGALALGIGILLAREGIRRELRRAPRWVLPVLIVAIIGLFALFIAISVAADRAVSVQRLFDVDVERDMRGRALPAVLAMIHTYFPMGSGLGSFDPMFRIAEPFTLLKPTYFNHAHNDFLEIALDGGLAGMVLLVAAIGWWGVASVRAWRGGAEANLARLGSSVLLLVFVASAFDYPARTPMLMATIVIAAVLLVGKARNAKRRAALPERKQHI